MRRAFREAGAATVVSTLWQVDDAAARKLIDAFYENLWRHRLPPSLALRQAQLDLLGEAWSAPPKHWAAFTLAGEWR